MNNDDVINKQIIYLFQIFSLVQLTLPDLYCHCFPIKLVAFYWIKWTVVKPFDSCCHYSLVRLNRNCFEKRLIDRKLLEKHSNKITCCRQTFLHLFHVSVSCTKSFFIITQRWLIINTFSLYQGQQSFLRESNHLIGQENVKNNNYI